MYAVSTYAIVQSDNIYIYIYIYIYTYVYVEPRGCSNLGSQIAAAGVLQMSGPNPNVYVYIYIYIYMYTCIYAYIHMYIYIYITHIRPVLKSSIWTNGPSPWEI